MSFIGIVIVFAVFAVGGVYVGDPEFRPDRDPGHWITSVLKGNSNAKHQEVDYGIRR